MEDINFITPSNFTKDLAILVYGTLREGGSLHHLIKPYIKNKIIKTTIKGDLYKSRSGEFPLLTEGEGDVIGEIFFADNTDRVLKILVNEEVKYGYSLRWVYHNKKEFRGRVLICQWENGISSEVKIEDGDWIKYQEKSKK